MAERVVVIGGGLSGLAASALLAKEGFSVTVVEKHRSPGGVARVFRESGYCFDMGPSWYLMPEVFDRFFSLFGKKVSDYYALRELDPSYQVFFEGGANAVISRDRKANKEIFDSFETGGGEKLDRYLRNSELKYSITLQDFLYTEFKTIFSLLSPKLIREGLKLNILQNLDSFIGRYFSSPKAKKVLGFNTVFLGSSPYKTPALYSLMSHADLTQGVYYPSGGMGSMVEGLRAVGEQHGVVFRFGETARKIVVDEGRASGVKTVDGFLPADIVLSAADYHYTDTVLLDNRYASYPPQYWDKRVMAPSTFIIYLGLSKKLKQLVHHNFFFADDWKENFRKIFDAPGRLEGASYYVGVPSKTDNTLCPPGGEVVFLLVPVAAALDDNDEFRENYANSCISHLETLIDDNIRPHTVVKRIYSRRDFINDNNIYSGASLGLAHTLLQTAFFRPSHKSRKLPNLYYTGHYTQPGVGVPMQLIGAEMIAKRIMTETTSKAVGGLWGSSH